MPGAGPGTTSPDALPRLASSPPPLPSDNERRQGAALHDAGVRGLLPGSLTAGDPRRAAALIDAAAHLGDADAQMLLAASHLFRPDGSRDAASALPWLHRAAQQGHAEAQLRLAQLLADGEGVRRDRAWAAVWFQRAAERGQPEAQFALALLQVLGEGTARDEAEALARLVLAEAGGVALARRYREALARRVPDRAARSALSRVRAERAEGPVVTPDRALIRFVQSALAKAGLWSGTVDGRDSPALRQAMGGFAVTAGIRNASAYGAETIDRLRLVMGESPAQQGR